MKNVKLNSNIKEKLDTENNQLIKNIDYLVKKIKKQLKTNDDLIMYSVNFTNTKSEDQNKDFLLSKQQIHNPRFQKNLYGIELPYIFQITTNESQEECHNINRIDYSNNIVLIIKNIVYLKESSIKNYFDKLLNLHINYLNDLPKLIDDFEHNYNNATVKTSIKNNLKFINKFLDQLNQQISER